MTPTDAGAALLQLRAWLESERRLAEGERDALPRGRPEAEQYYRGVLAAIAATTRKLEALAGGRA